MSPSKILFHIPRLSVCLSLCLSVYPSVLPWFCNSIIRSTCPKNCLESFACNEKFHYEISISTYYPLSCYRGARKNSCRGYFLIYLYFHYIWWFEIILQPLLNLKYRLYSALQKNSPFHYQELENLL